ncbi:MAG: NAD(P)H-dependent oxidoreductase subunit E [Candidatus Cloacimonetes bacterium]|nr:NAD(P)H-dependent oxidoreductase subunit E [Candidatus Cloacimonadota bacterium]
MTPATQQDNLLYDQLREVIAASRELRNPLIEVLRQAQEIFGYLPVEVQEFIAREMNIPANKVFGVVTFYNFFTMTPRGKYTLNICMGTACYVKGAPKLAQMIEEELGVKVGETTQDNRFTVSAVRCVGACSLAPVFVIGDEAYGRVDTRDKLSEILKKYE